MADASLILAAALPLALMAATLALVHCSTTKTARVWPTAGCVVGECGPISKQRNKHLQRVLVEAAKVAPQFNERLRDVHRCDIGRAARCSQTQGRGEWQAASSSTA